MCIADFLFCIYLLFVYTFIYLFIVKIMVLKEFIYLKFKKNFWVKILVLKELPNEFCWS